jgi:phage terminase large subunit-like protein
MLQTSRYDAKKAERVVTFIEQLKHTKGEFHGQNFLLLEWQKEIIRTVFGVIKADGYRQFKTCYCEVAKKQGKTTLAAAIALYLLLADGEHGAEIYSCAADRAQASLIYQEAVNMAELCPAIRKRVKIIQSQKRMVFAEGQAFYQVLSSESYGKHGLNPHAVLFDETHVADREMFRIMTHGASDARRQPVHLFITTAGNDTNSIGYELHCKAKDVRDGKKIDSTFLPIIYAADEADDWVLPATWTKANPSLGVTVQLENLKLACESAKQTPSEENSFRQLRLCQWVKQNVRWLPLHLWDKCEEVFEERDLEKRVCYGGLDLSSTGDITAFVLVFPPTSDDDKYFVLPYFWIPEDNLGLRVRRDHVPYDEWKRLGLLQTTEGNVIHYGFIERFIEKLGERFNIREIAFDRWGATHVAQNLEDAGFVVVPFGQGFASMSPPTKELEMFIKQQRVAQNGNLILRWMLDNVSIRMDAAGNVKPDKEKSSEKIDGVVAMIMALDRAIRCGAASGESIYSSRGLLIL